MTGIAVVVVLYYSYIEITQQTSCKALTKLLTLTYIVGDGWQTRISIARTT